MTTYTRPNQLNGLATFGSYNQTAYNIPNMKQPIQHGLNQNAISEPAVSRVLLVPSYGSVASYRSLTHGAMPTGQRYMPVGLAYANGSKCVNYMAGSCYNPGAAL